MEGVNGATRPRKPVSRKPLEVGRVYFRHYKLPTGGVASLAVEVTFFGPEVLGLWVNKLGHEIHATYGVAFCSPKERVFQAEKARKIALGRLVCAIEKPLTGKRLVAYVEQSFTAVMLHQLFDAAYRELADNRGAPQWYRYNFRALPWGMDPVDNE